MSGRPTALTWAHRNWFFIAFAVILAASYGFARSNSFLAEGGEAAIIADLCLTVPLLHCWCYWNQLPWRQLAIRAGALFCLGVWVAAQFIPAADQAILPHLSWARALGIMVLALIELRVMAAVVRLAFSDKATAEELSARSGAPPVIARLLLMEARFWRRIWKLLLSTFRP
jgi:hypothetical protein